MKTEEQIRSEFRSYFLDLREAMKADGVKVDKATEWSLFIETQIENGEAPAEARNWKAPKSLA